MIPPSMADLLDTVRGARSAADLDDRLARGHLWAGTVLDRLEHRLTWPHRLGWDRLCLACVEARHHARQAGGLAPVELWALEPDTTPAVAAGF